MPRARATNRERESRVLQVFRLLRLGSVPCEISQLLMTQYGLSQRQAERYLKDAYDLLRVVPEKVVDLIDIAIAQMDHVYQQAIKANNFNAAIHANTQKMKFIQERIKYASASSTPSSPTASDSLDSLIQSLEASESMASQD